MKLASITCVLATLAVGCGSSDNGVAKLDPNRRLMLRVDVAGSAGNLEVHTSPLINVARDQAPGASLAGDLMLVSYASGRVHEAMPFGMPRRALVESWTAAGMDGVSIPLDRSALALFLDASVPLDRIEVLDESGTVVASVASDAIPQLSTEGFPVPSVHVLSTGPTRYAFNQLVDEYPQIAFFDPDGGDAVPIAYAVRQSIRELVPISEEGAGNLLRALKRVPSATLSAIRGVGIAKFTDQNVGGLSFGSSLFVSHLIEKDTNKSVETIVHEGTHTFQYLVDGDLETELWNPEAWPPDVRAAAAETIGKYALEAGVTRVWAGLHKTGVGAAVAGPYLDSGWMAATDEEAAASGFASAYGAKDAGEDMAEYAARLAVPEYAGESPVCRIVRNAGVPFPPTAAIPFAKVKLIEGLGLASADQVATCIGQPAIQGPPGIHLGNSSNFTSELKAGWLNQDGAHFLAASGAAPPYRILIRVLAPDDQALGVHRLDSIGYSNLIAANNAVYLSHDESELRARVSASGLVLITTVSTRKIEGALLFLSLRNAPGLITDVFPVSTFLIPGQP